jgi:hypothetical protein
MGTFGFYQYTTDITSLDWIERAYIFGTTDFNLKPDMLFVVSGLDYTIENLEVTADNDNFDYESNWVVNLTANSILKGAFDPYNLIPATGANGRVELVYTGPGKQYSSYGLGSYLRDQAADVLFSVFPPPRYTSSCPTSGCTTCWACYKYRLSWQHEWN